MAKVDTNVVGLAYAVEDVAGTKIGTGARVLEPNEITQFGASITTVAREPISDRLQRRKGSTTDLDSTTAFGADITVDGLWDWLEAAIFAKSVNADVRDMAVEAATVAGAITLVRDLVAPGAGKLEDDTLLWGVWLRE